MSTLLAGVKPAKGTTLSRILQLGIFDADTIPWRIPLQYQLLILFEYHNLRQSMG